MSTADEVIATIEAVTGEMEVQVNRELPLFELQLLDSLQTVELLVALCERFHVDVALSEIVFQPNQARPFESAAGKESSEGQPMINGLQQDFFIEGRILIR